MSLEPIKIRMLQRKLYQKGRRSRTTVFHAEGGGRYGRHSRLDARCQHQPDGCCVARAGEISKHAGVLGLDTSHDAGSFPLKPIRDRVSISDPSFSKLNSPPRPLSTLRRKAHDCLITGFDKF